MSAHAPRARERHKRLAAMAAAVVAAAAALGAAAAAAATPSGTGEGHCEPIQVSMCRGLGYNLTASPNLLGHERQRDAEMALAAFAPLVQYGCAPRLRLFLCAAFAPLCTPKVQHPVGPCRTLCERVRARCLPVLRGFGFQWPSLLNCSKFPVANNHETMCMEGPASPSTPPSQTPPQPCVAPFLFSAPSARCAQRCHAEVLWLAWERRLAAAWIAVWAAAAAASAGAGALALAGGEKRPRAHHHSRHSGGGRWRAPALCLALCHAAQAAGWAVAGAAGRDVATCVPLAAGSGSHDANDAAGGAEMVLAGEGDVPATCALVFLLLYYFAVAASLWWCVLCAAWWSRITRRLPLPPAVIGSSPVCVHVDERIAGAEVCCSGGNAVISGGVCSGGGGGGREERRVPRWALLSHLVAWGVPAALCVAALLVRAVGADELTGACVPGARSERHLLLFLVAPHALALLSGAVLLAAALAALLRCPQSPFPRQNATGWFRQGAWLAAGGAPLACVVAAYAYEFAHRSQWTVAALRAHGPPTQGPRPLLWVFLLRLAAGLAVGATAVLWASASGPLSAFRRMCRRVGPCKGAGADTKCGPLTLQCYSPLPPPPQVQHPPSRHKRLKRSHGNETSV